MHHRLEKLNTYLLEENLDGIVLASATNSRYFSGFTGSNRWLLITPDKRLLVTDQRYGEQAQRETTDFEIVVTSSTFMDELMTLLKSLGWRRIGYESDTLSDRYARRLRTEIPADWVALNDFALAWRAVKDDTEISIIRESIAMADRCLALLMSRLKVGMSEREIKAELEYLMAIEGSDSPAFGTIVGGGERSALPHATASDYRLKEGDLCVIDFGTTVQGYYSDLTRTLCFGSISEEKARLFSLVETSQEKAFQSISPGVTTGEIDRAHREIFLAHDMDDYALRGLGHGIGLDIHEWPRVVIGGKEIVEPGMIFTVEPGLYVPGVGGVRKEDVVLVTEEGMEILTSSPPRLIVEVIA